MIWSSRFGKLGVLVASVGVHTLATYVWWSEPAVQVTGGAEASVQAQFGNSFEALVAGTMTPQTPQTAEDIEPTETTERVKPETQVLTSLERAETETEKPVEQTQPETVEAAPAQKSVVPQRTETDAPIEDLIAPALPEDATPNETAIALAPEVTNPDRADLAASVDAAPVEAADAIEPIVPKPERTEPQITQAVPTEPTITAAAPPPDVQEALPEIGVQVSRRPQVRPRRIEDEAQQRRAVQTPQQQEREPEPAPRVQQGKAQEDATLGTITGTNQSQANEQSTRKVQSAAEGNAAASNYPGLVNRKLSRVPRPRMGSRGTAVVNFSIAANGGLSGVSIVRSSGSARLDQAAVQLVRRAAPFPTPPAGAQRTFTISIKGGG